MGTCTLFEAAGVFLSACSLKVERLLGHVLIDHFVADYGHLNLFSFLISCYST